MRRARCAKRLTTCSPSFWNEAIERKVDLAFECDEDCRVKCAAAGVLVSVVGNLVANAIKFIDEASIDRRIAVHTTLTPKNILIEVSDTGPGLAPGTEKRVFEPYVRLGTAKSRGIGLGLATVKRLVEAHGDRSACAAASRGGASSGSSFRPRRTRSLWSTRPIHPPYTVGRSVPENHAAS